eukprot:GHVT01035484.1.p1 GENE.GHVT01035484.1~~GHVT01035484.1.p1  ORF type:complete len:189 (+),score=27.24 GHVT01035484.1:228-794(+)
MSPAAFSHDCAPQTGHEPTEEEPLSDSTKQIAVGPKKPKGISKFWTGVAVFSLGGGIVSAISSHKDLLYGVGRPKKSNQGNIAHLTNAPLGAGAAGHLALPPPQAALPMAFPLVARAPHNEAPAAMSQLRRDFEECLHEVCTVEPQAVVAAFGRKYYPSPLLSLFMCDHGCCRNWWRDVRRFERERFF